MGYLVTPRKLNRYLCHPFPRPPFRMSRIPGSFEYRSLSVSSASRGNKLFYILVFSALIYECACPGEMIKITPDVSTVVFYPRCALQRRFRCIQVRKTNGRAAARFPDERYSSHRREIRKQKSLFCQYEHTLLRLLPIQLLRVRFRVLRTLLRRE